MWGQIIGAVIGGVAANKAAKTQAKAIDRANEQNNQYLNAAMPYIKDNMGRVTGFYDDMLSKGPYQGDFYAGPNQMQTDAINSMYNVGNANVNLGNSITNTGNNLTNTGTDLMNQADGFVGNASDLYSQYTNMANRPDMMAQADQYAQSNMSPIVTAMMRDQKRTLTEQTLPGINKAASGSGNANSSRAGVADAIANRDYQDRLADVSTDVYNSLRDARLSQSNTEFGQTMDALSGAGSANSTLGNAFVTGGNMVTTGANLANTGANLATTGAGTALNAGNAMNTLDQGQLDADKAQYDYLNNYNYNLGKDYMGFLTGNNVSGNYAMNAVSPGAATLGGAMSGFGFGNQYLSGRPGGFGNQAMFDPLFGGGPGLGGFV